MIPRSSADTEDMKMNWTVLPPIKLKGVGTSLVESVSSYVARMLWTTGVPLNHLVERVARHAITGAGSVHTFMQSEALNAVAISRIEQLELLSGEENLRCGSLWALSEIISFNTSAYGEYKRIWCPKCYGEWDDESYEPLLWRVDLLGACPRHGCRMECVCPCCGRFQRQAYVQEQRRACWSCGTSLATGASWSKRPEFSGWIDNQIMQLIEFCATPRAAPASLSIYADFARGMHASAKSRGKKSVVMKDIIKGIERHARHNSRRPTLRSLLNVCALQGVSVQEFLSAPMETSGAMLFDQWPGMKYLPLPSAVHAQRIHAASRYLEDFLALDPPIFPPMNLLLRCFHIQLLALRDVADDIFSTYEERYLSQGSCIRRTRLHRSLLAVMRVFADQGKKRPEIHNEQARNIARDTKVSLEDVAMVLETVKMMRETQAAERIAAYRAELPIRSALDWFLERRRFS